MRRLPAILLVLTCLAAVAAAQDRFPRPDFDTDYTRPTPDRPDPTSTRSEYVDVAVLALALAAAAVLAIRLRSRRAVFVLMVGSLAYFGFYREGCVCPIGAIQNVSLAIFSPDYALPWTVAAFFLLPLAATLVAGRGFCAGVCPLGAIQDLLLLRPVRLPRFLQQALGMLPYVYLGAAVLFAATGSAFIICRYDPFVALFRLSGKSEMWILGVCVLLIGVFVGRPYCRFICPYGALLRHFSKLSQWRVTITPDECVQCRLCEDACPFGAISEPTLQTSHGSRRRGKGVLAAMIALLPVLVVGGGFVGWLAREPLSRMHPTIRTAERVRLEALGAVEGTDDLSDAFRHTGGLKEDLYAEAARVGDRFATGGMLLGGFLGLVFGLKLVQVSVRRTRTDYEADRATCLACGRCFRYCPREQLRKKKRKGLPPDELT